MMMMIYDNHHQVYTKKFITYAQSSNLKKANIDKEILLAKNNVSCILFEKQILVTN